MTGLSLKYWRSIWHVLRRPDVPPDVIFFITSKCNARCDYCHFLSQIEDPARKERELPVDKIQAIARQWGRVGKLSLCGGEPFIRQDVAEIVQAFVDHGGTQIVDIPTNGYFTESIIAQTDKILARNPSLVLEIQMSIDGPREVHDKVRRVEGLFDRAMRTIEQLHRLREQRKNLRIKLNLVYQEANARATYQMAKDFEKQFLFDRFQITYPHGGAALKEKIAALSYQRFYRLSRRIQLGMKVRNRFDVHSLIFRAVKILRDEVLAEVINKTDMGAICQAGKRIIVIDDVGEVYPCEPLWESVGSLPAAGYRIRDILGSERMRQFGEKHLGPGKCHCTWGCVVLDQIIFSSRYYGKIIYYMILLFFVGGKGLPDWDDRYDDG